MAVQRICKIEGCGKRHLALGFCPMHYRQWKVHGKLSPDRQKPLNLTGRVFARLMVVDPAPAREDGLRRWRCLCQCGQRVEVVTSKLTSGHTRSCGCFLADKNRELRKTHGHRPKIGPSLTYKSYTNMLTRCENPNAINYHLYGGAGVRVCDRWRHADGSLGGFENFLADMGERPSPSHSIDRFPDRDGNYEPGNCRWATASQQMQNRDRTLTVQVDGRSVPLVEACDLTGIKYGTANARLRFGRPWDQKLWSRHG